MRTNKNKLFTIGQFAAIHEITKKTLMWYDEIGLFKPAVLGENGYRYYTYQQSPILETILMLRQLDVSIPEIQAFMANRSAASMQQLMGEKIAELEGRIAQLKNLKETLVSRQQDMITLQNINLEQITIVERKKCYLAVLPTTGEESAETEIERVIDGVKKHQLHHLHDAVYGAMIPVSSLQQECFTAYCALYIELPCPPSKKGLMVRPAGQYLRAFCQGSWDKLPQRYREILAFANEQGFNLGEYSYETGLNEAVIDRFEEYITQIEIPILSDEQDSSLPC